MFDAIIDVTLDDLQGGYVDTYYYDCDWPGSNNE